MALDTPTPEDLRQLLESSGALREGHFLLSSGRHSPAYVQCALLLEDPARARRLGGELAVRLRAREIDCVVAAALGGIVIGHEVAAALEVPFRFAERQNGALDLRRGFVLGAGERVAVVEDVVTTGRSTREVVAVVETAGADVVAVGSILDRSAGRAAFGVPFEALLSLDLPTFAPDECPLCKGGGRPVKPGSRPQ